MARKKPLKSARAGAVMTLVLLAIVLLLLTGAGVLALGQNSRIFSIRTTADIAARAAADAGITKALWTMNGKVDDGFWDWRLISWEFRAELPNSDATYSYFVSKAGNLLDNMIPDADEDLRALAAAAAENGDYVIRSVGRYRDARKTIYAVLRLKGPGDAGVLVRDSIILKSGTLVAGRDSRDPDNLDPDVFLEIGTTSTADDQVILNRGVLVDGNVLVGRGGDVDAVIRDVGVIAGIEYPFPEQPEFPFVFPPKGLPDIGPITFKGGTLPITESGKCSSIYLKHGNPTTTLLITGGDVTLHVTGDIDLGQGCEIVIDEGATLNLYVDGDIICRNEAGINNQGTPPDLKIWGNWRDLDTEQDFQLNAKSEYFGQLYAPGADVVVMAKGDLYGAFTAESFEMKSGGNLFYDGALSDVAPGDQGVSFVVSRWCEQ